MATKNNPCVIHHYISKVIHVFDRELIDCHGNSCAHLIRVSKHHLLNSIQYHFIYVKQFHKNIHLFIFYGKENIIREITPVVMASPMIIWQHWRGRTPF